MSEHSFQYYNGVSARPYQVRMELINHEIHLYDTSFNSDNGISYSLKNCHHVIVKSKAFIYLNDKATEYIVLPADSDYYQEIIADIKASDTSWYSKLFNQKWYVLTGELMAVLASVYLFFNYVVPPIAMQFISVKQEISIGNNFYNSFTENEEIDSTATFILQKFADDLHLSSKYPIRVTVVKSNVVNAFALPGGRLVVYSGIISKMENPQELVALLSHESSHVNKRHSMKSIVTRMSSSILISLATKDANGLSKGILDNVNTLRVLSYSRELETEADNEGMKLMVSNNINPIGMKWLMEDLRKLNMEVPQSISFLSTHPLTDERIKNATNFSKKYIQMNTPMKDVQISLWNELKKGE